MEDIALVMHLLGDKDPEVHLEDLGEDRSLEAVEMALEVDPL